MKIEDLISRTNQKLNFARIHLEELKEIPASRGRGSDFERSHQEAFLAQLFGAYYAFLIELNQYLGCGLPEDQVTPGNMRDALKKQGKSSPILTELHLRTGKNIGEEDWFIIVKILRGYSTHISGIPLAYHHPSGKTALINPATKKEQDEDFIVEFSSWLSEMKQLIDRLRKEATEGLGEL